MPITCRLIAVPTQISHGEAGTMVDLDLRHLFSALRELILCHNERVENPCPCGEGGNGGGSGGSGGSGGGGGGGGGGGCQGPFCPPSEEPLTWGMEPGALLASDGAGGVIAAAAAAGGISVVSASETTADTVTTTETNVLEVGPVTVSGQKVLLTGYCEVVRGSGLMPPVATLRIRRGTGSPVSPSDTLVCEARAEIVNGGAPGTVALSITDSPPDGTYYYALMGISNGESLSYEDKALTALAIGVGSGSAGLDSTQEDLQDQGGVGSY